MLSEEEVEYLNDLEKALEDNDSFYWQEDMHELIKMLKQKDKKEQNLIEKLEENIEEYRKCMDKTDIKLNKIHYMKRIEYAKEVLKIIKE